MSYRPGWGADPGHHRPRYTGVSELHELGRLGSVRLWGFWEEVPEGVTGPLGGSWAPGSQGGTPPAMGGS